MFQVAFGVLGLDRETFWEMTPREFFNAWEGYLRHQEEQLDGYFYLIQQHATWTAFSKEQSRAIQKAKPPWHASANGKRSDELKPLNYDKMKGVFNTISKPEVTVKQWLSTRDISKRAAKALLDAGVTTMQQVRTHITNNTLDTLPGIGPAYSEEITKAV